MTDLERLRAALRSIVPALAEAELRPAGSGECNDAWWVGEDHIARIAKQGAAEALAVEMAVLPALADAIDVSIPHPVGFGQDPETGRPLLVHRAVRGTPLSPGRWKQLSSTERRALAEALGTFLVQLQAHRPAPLSVNSQGDPACDLGMLMDDFGLDFVADVVRTLPNNVAKQRLERARSYCVWEALSWAAEELDAGTTGDIDEHLHRIGDLACAPLPAP